MTFYLFKRNRPRRKGLIKMNDGDRCPSLRCVCGRVIHYSAFAYCPYCGQKLDWEGVARDNGSEEE